MATLTRPLHSVFGALLAAGLLSRPAFAEQQTLTGYAQSTELLTQLLGLFVTATVLESALTTIFQWRLYREFLNGRAVKTLVMIVVSYAVVRSFEYDVFAKIMGYAGGIGASSRTSRILSALVLAGGSAAIYQMLVTLGFRSPVTPPQSEPKPPENLAWVSIKVVRKTAIGGIRIHVDEVAAPAAELAASPALSGEIGDRTFGDRLRGLFFADSMRFPNYGGQTVNANQVYRISASGKRAADTPGDPLVDFDQEIFVGRFASRAIIDFVQEI
ncbi:hypothetical protein [Rhizobium leguminosarum]|uniref:hypothetical protein n=1 Tax=Rhizobium leguminosarum TaxID=384 RepID=UPI001C92065A|nr:hypothetical protein [Rhizobium leguminosarum]MBY2937938.1 hypothetical protein [Rhizobium leguminosarum]